MNQQNRAWLLGWALPAAALCLMNAALILAYVIDNDIVDGPEIQCTDQSVRFTFRAKNPFRGNVFVRGQFGLPQCRKEFYNNDNVDAVFEVQVGDCAMTKSKQLNPPGIAYNLVIMTSFHPRFVTKVDRAFNIICFYRQMDKPVGVDLEISGPTPSPIQREAIMYPDCEYSMRLNSFDGPIAPTTVRVGELIVHRWDCGGNNRENIFGMLVKNCKVYDGGEEGVLLIDERGCPIKTSVIQSPPSYDETLTMAFAPVFAFSFPDRTQMNFRCQIQACNKHENECEGLTPPNCASVDTPLGGAGYQPGYISSSNYVDQQSGGGYGQQPVVTQQLGGQYPNQYANPAVSGGGIPYSSRGTSPYRGTTLGRYPPVPQTADHSFGSALPTYPTQNIPRPYSAARTSRRRANSGQLHMIRLNAHQMHGTMTFDGDRNNVNDSSEALPASDLILLHKPGRSARAHADPTAFFQPLDTEATDGQSQPPVRSERQRRAEAKTMDVVSRPMDVINDNGLDESFGNVKNRHPVHHSELYQRSSLQNYCMDRNLFTALITSTGLLGVLATVMAGYIFYDLIFKRRKIDFDSYFSRNPFKFCRTKKQKGVVWPPPQRRNYFTDGGATKQLSEVSNIATNSNIGKPTGPTTSRNHASALAEILNNGISGGINNGGQMNSHGGVQRIAELWNTEQRPPPPMVPLKPFQQQNK